MLGMPHSPPCSYSTQHFLGVQEKDTPSLGAKFSYAHASPNLANPRGLFWFFSSQGTLLGTQVAGSGFTLLAKPSLF